MALNKALQAAAGNAGAAPSPAWVAEWSTDYYAAGAAVHVVEVDADDNVYACDVDRLSADAKIRITKFTSEGELVWSKYYQMASSSTYRVVQCSVALSNGDIVFAGQGDVGAWIIAVDSDGAVSNFVRFTRTSDDQEIYDIAELSDGKIVFVGEELDNAPSATRWGSYIGVLNTDFTLYAYRVFQSGTVSSGADEFKGVVVDSSDNIYVCGRGDDYETILGKTNPALSTFTFRDFTRTNLGINSGKLVLVNDDLWFVNTNNNSAAYSLNIVKIDKSTMAAEGTVYGYQFVDQPNSGVSVAVDSEGYLWVQMRQNVWNQLAASLSKVNLSNGSIVKQIDASGYGGQGRYNGDYFDYYISQNIRFLSSGSIVTACNKSGYNESWTGNEHRNGHGTLFSIDPNVEDVLVYGNNGYVNSIIPIEVSTPNYTPTVTSTADSLTSVTFALANNQEVITVTSETNQPNIYTEPTASKGSSPINVYGFIALGAVGSAGFPVLSPLPTGKMEYGDWVFVYAAVGLSTLSTPTGWTPVLPSILFADDTRDTYLQLYARRYTAADPFTDWPRIRSGNSSYAVSHGAVIIRGLAETTPWSNIQTYTGIDTNVPTIPNITSIPSSADGSVIFALSAAGHGGVYYTTIKANGYMADGGSAWNDSVDMVSFLALKYWFDGDGDFIGGTGTATNDSTAHSNAGFALLLTPA